MKRRSQGFLTAILSAFLFLIRYLPTPLFRFLVVTAGFIARHLNTKARATARSNIQTVFGIPPGSTTYDQEVMTNISAVALESIRAGYAPGKLRIDGYQELKSLVDRNLAAGKGLIFVTAHLGSWELTSLVCHWACGGSYYGLAKSSKTAAVTTALKKWRKIMNIKQLWTDHPDLIQNMVKVVKDGNGIGFAMDQKPDPVKSGVEVKFLGQPTPIVTGPAWISAQNSAPVMSVFVIRQGPMHYKVVAQQIIPPNHQEKNLVKLTEIMAREVEKAIYKYGNQWVWTYRRWSLPEAADQPANEQLPLDLVDSEVT